MVLVASSSNDFNFWHGFLLRLQNPPFVYTTRASGEAAHIFDQILFGKRRWQTILYSKILKDTKENSSIGRIAHFSDRSTGLLMDPSRSRVKRVYIYIYMKCDKLVVYTFTRLNLRTKGLEIFCDAIRIKLKGLQYRVD